MQGVASVQRSFTHPCHFYRSAILERNYFFLSLFLKFKKLIADVDARQSPRMGAWSSAGVLSEIADTASSCGCSSAEEITCQETCCPDVARLRNARFNRIKDKIIAFSHAKACAASTRTTSSDDKGFDAREGQSECEISGNNLRPIRLLKWQTIRSSLLRGAPQTFNNFFSTC